MLSFTRIELSMAAAPAPEADFRQQRLASGCL